LLQNYGNPHELGDALVRLIDAELQTGEVVWGKARGRR
jgi:hypothetical protein